MRYYLVFLQLLCERWQIDVSERILKEKNILVAIEVTVIILFFVLFVLSVQKGVISFYEKEYHVYKEIYKNYVPDYIVQKDKRIKYWLVKHSIIKL